MHFILFLAKKVIPNAIDPKKQLFTYDLSKYV